MVWLGAFIGTALLVWVVLRSRATPNTLAPGGPPSASAKPPREEKKAPSIAPQPKTSPSPSIPRLVHEDEDEVEVTLLTLSPQKSGEDPGPESKDASTIALLYEDEEARREEITSPTVRILVHAA